MLLYRAGSGTLDNLTPRLGADTTPAPGRPPGLSVFDDPIRAAGGKSGNKVQVIDSALLPPGLRVFPDDPARGGSPGHFAIAPVDGGQVLDQALLEDWASTRQSGTPHPLAPTSHVPS